MARYNTTITSTHSVDDAFAYMAQFDNVREWDPSVRRADYLSDGPVTLGSQFLVEAEFRGRPFPLTYTVTEILPGSRVVVEAENARVRSRDVITVSVSDGTTRVSYDATLTTKGLFKVFEPIVALSFRRLGDAAAAGLTRALNR